MCGRFDRHSEPVAIAKAFMIDHFDVADYKQSFNVSPSQNIVIVKDDGRRHLVQCRWGFIPPWLKDSSPNAMINARAETVAEKSAFRDAFRRSRCLVIADGFYEWKRDGKARRPVYVRLKSCEPFGMAGIYSLWHSPDGEDICTCAIITTDANELLRPVHDRMPVIIPKELEDIWLNPRMADNELVMSILTPFSADLMECYEVSGVINRADFDKPEAIEPLSVDNI